MSDDECSAELRDGESPPNPLFTPPCTCPACAPVHTYDRSGGDGWLRVRGHQQRYRVRELELGALGKAVLG